MCVNFESLRPDYGVGYEVNLEIIHVADGVALEYSFRGLSIYCEIPKEKQMCVYVQNASSVYIQLDYTPDLTSLIGYRIIEDTIIINGPPIPPNRLIKITRCTNLSRISKHFTDGARLNAKDLMINYYQLLALIQEKKFAESTITHVHPTPTLATASPWQLNTVYSLNDVVSYTLENNEGEGYMVGLRNISTAYRAIQVIVPINVKPGHGSSWDEYWELLTFTTTGIVIKNTGLSGRAPLVISLTNLQPDQYLKWNGTTFINQTISNPAIAGFGAVVITNPQNNDTLVYSSNQLAWINSPQGENATDFNEWLKYTYATGSDLEGSYDNISINAGPLATLKSYFAEGNAKWVIPNPPTVYNIIRKVIPGQEDPTAYFVTEHSNLVTVTNTANGALQRSGGTMSGVIAMGSSKITGLANPTNLGDAATKGYVDNSVSIGAIGTTVSFALNENFPLPASWHGFTKPVNSNVVTCATGTWSGTSSYSRTITGTDQESLSVSEHVNITGTVTIPSPTGGSSGLGFTGGSSLVILTRVS
jgi:hypothetical protein